MPLSVNVDSIPEELKNIPNWVLWKLEERGGEKTKIPYQVNGKRADSTDPNTWGNFEVIYETYQGNGEKYSGIGFCLSEETGIIGVDWDKVKKPDTEEWNDETLSEIMGLGSYAELSQSGTGAHVLIKAVIPGPRRRKDNLEMYSGARWSDEENRYIKGRFFVVTGSHIKSSPAEIRENQEAINELYKKRFGDAEQKKTKKETQPITSPKLTNEEIIDIASRAKNGYKFKRLYNGDTSGYKSDSDADLAFCSMLAFYTQDYRQIESIVFKSGMYREKWNRSDYKDRTINAALQGVTEIYDPEKKSKNKAGEDKKDKIIVHFDEVADRILRNDYIFSMRDNGQIFLYRDGVYISKDTEAILGTLIRDAYFSLYVDRWKDQNPGKDLPDHIPKATTKFVNEALAYIRAYTHIARDSIEADQARYINFKNCLFNLETWQIEDHKPEIKSICQIPVYYNKNAECPKINNFLKSVVVEPDIDLLCEIAGYCLTTDCSYQKAFMLYGVGSNGKSVFLALLEALIGGENTSAESLQKLEFDKYRTAKLYGKRVNICGDIPDSKMHKSEVFKKLTSGLDLIDGENKYQDSFTFRNTAKLVFSANILPEGKKDKAYYRRWTLIQFPNNFEGGNEDKNLINKLREPGELSGFLNLALEGLKRLKINGKFSNDKSIEDTQKEYEFNSNPVAAFMDECTQISDEDCDATILYLTYVQWCQVYGKPHMSNIGFSRKLNQMGYTSHRENEPGSYSSKKIPKWDNLKIRQDRIGQDRTRYEKGNFLSCPGPHDSEKSEIGQDANPFVAVNNLFLENNSNEFVYVSTHENSEKGQNSKIPLTRKDLSCPNLGFSDSGSHRTGCKDKIENYPVLEQKTIFLEQLKDQDSIKKLEYLGAFKRDLKTLVCNNYNCVVENVPELLDHFNRQNPGYRQVLGDEVLIEEAEKLNTWGWK